MSFSDPEELIAPFNWGAENPIGSGVAATF